MLAQIQIVRSWVTVTMYRTTDTLTEKSRRYKPDDTIRTADTSGAKTNSMWMRKSSVKCCPIRLRLCYGKKGALGLLRLECSDSGCPASRISIAAAWRSLARMRCEPQPHRDRRDDSSDTSTSRHHRDRILSEPVLRVPAMCASDRVVIYPTIQDANRRRNATIAKSIFRLFDISVLAPWDFHALHQTRDPELKAITLPSHLTYHIIWTAYNG